MTLSLIRRLSVRVLVMLAVLSGVTFVSLLHIAVASAYTNPELNTMSCNVNSAAALNSSNCGIIHYIVVFTNALSALVGIVVVGSIIMAGIQYSAAGSDASKVSAAKNRIRNAIMALLLFIFMYAILQWIIPGGLF
jgi:hypothetical protein